MDSRRAKGSSNRRQTIRRAGAIAFGAAGLCVASRSVNAQLAGELGAHDPSSLAKDGTRYYYFATGQGIISRNSADKVNWVGGPSVFGAPPAWTTQAVPSFTGFFWAPDVAYFNGTYHLYYSVSSWGTIDSAIGLVTSPSLANPTWADQGKVVQSDAAGFTQPGTDTTAYNAIDPSILLDNSTGKVWMSFGSYSSGILVTELNPSTGKRLNESTLSAALVANNAPGGGWGSSIEGSSLIKRGSFYYLFVNYGGCCAGVNSTYDIRVGRSTSPTGPFVDKNGVDMRNGGGTMFLDDDGKMIGPGHFSYFSEAGQDSFGYHYYNGDFNGAPTYGQRNLYWTADAWPSYAAINPDWTGTINTGWSSSANWSGGTVPNGVGHIANFGSNLAGRYVVSLDTGRTLSTVNFTGTASYTIGTTGHVLTLDAQTGDSATLNVQSGTHTINSPISVVDSLGINILGGGKLNLSGSVTGTGLTKYGHGTVAVNSTATFSNPMLLKWGFVEVNGAVTANGYTSMGPSAGEGGVMVVRGSGSFTANGDVNVGDTGSATEAATGWLEIHDNANVTVNSAGGFFVGSGFFANTRASGIVTQTGGTLTTNGNFDGAFIIGGRNSGLGTGTYNLSGGTVNANTNVRVGGLGTGTITQTGGAFNAAGYVAIGRFAGATGAWDISGGTLSHTNAGTMIIVGEQGNGTLSVSGAGQVTSAASLRLGHAAGGTGTVNLNGGTITARSVSRGSGSATFNLNGGTLRAGANSATFMQGLNAAYVKSGGAVLDTQAFSVSIAQPLLHDPALGGLDGGLTKQGGGTLTLSGSNTYTGPTIVNAGTLKLTQSSRSSSALNIAGGAAFVMTPRSGAVKTLQVGALDLGANSKLDLADNDLVVANAQFTVIRDLVISGFGNTIGITSSTSNGSQILALFDNALVGAGDWNGGTIGPNAVVGKYTYFGDANIDGQVTGDDYTVIDANLNSSPVVGLEWLSGDMNLDGTVTGDDYTVIDANLGLGSGSPLAPSNLSVVPEPAVGLCAVVGAILLRGRANAPRKRGR